ncbi:MAG: hypothetical protein JNL36_11055 [Candidatus Kapabacteria bacterium]|nr:hypothetical protein [Candidatus Kapabacteria bacterium]
MKRSSLLLLVGTIVLTILLSSCEETVTPIDPGNGGDNSYPGFSGAVKDSTTNSPVVGANVWLFAQPTEDATVASLRAKSPSLRTETSATIPFDHRYSGTPLQKVTTDTAGRFVFDTTQFTSNNYIVVVTHPNYTWKYVYNKTSKGLGTLYTKPVITVPAGQGQTLNWNVKDQDYVVTGSISPTSITISDGVRVRVNAGSGITFLNGGTLTANSSSEPIRITVNSDNSTDYMGNIGILTSNVTLNNVFISGAGSGNNPALTLDEAAGSVTKTIISNCNNGMTVRGVKLAASLTLKGIIVRNITTTGINITNSINNSISNCIVYNTNLGVNYTANSSIDFSNCYIEGNTNGYNATGGQIDLTSCEIVAKNGTSVQLRNPSTAALDLCELVGKVSLDSDAAGTQVGYISDCNLMGTDAKFVILASISYNFLNCYFDGTTNDAGVRSKITIPAGNNINDLQVLGTVYTKIPNAGLKTN